MLAKDMDQTMIRVSTDIPGGPPGKDLAPPLPFPLTFVFRGGVFPFSHGTQTYNNQTWNLSKGFFVHYNYID